MAFLQLPQGQWCQTKDSNPEFEQKYLGRIAKVLAIERWKPWWINGAQLPSGENEHTYCHANLYTLVAGTEKWYKTGILSTFIKKMTPSRLHSTLLITTVDSYRCIREFI